MEFNKCTNNSNNNNSNNDRPSPPPEIRGMFGNKGDSQDWLGKCYYYYYLRCITSTHTRI